MDRIRAILESNQIPFELIHHQEPIHSAQEGAEYFGIELGQTAPTLIVRTDKGFFALIVSGDRGRVNFKEVAKILECNQAKLAGAHEVKQVTGYDVGSVPLVGLPIPHVLDSRLFRYPFIYGGSGEPTWTLKINSALEKVNQVVGHLD